MKSLGIVVCDISYSHDKAKPEEVFVQIMGSAPDKALIFAAGAEYEKIYFRVIGQMKNSGFADRVLAIPVGEFCTLGISGDFEAELIGSLKDGGERKIDQLFESALAMFEPILKSEEIAGQFRGSYIIFAPLGVCHSSDEYQKLTEEYRYPWETAVARAILKLPSGIFIREELNRAATYANYPKRGGQMKEFGEKAGAAIAGELGITGSERIGVMNVIDDASPFCVAAVIGGKVKLFDPARLSSDLYGIALDLALA